MGMDKVVNRGPRHLKEYLGDGVYAMHDGYQLWLLVERHGRIESVAMDDHTLAALDRFRKRLAEMPVEEFEGAVSPI